MKRLNRKEEAVSPVIATILMVAITVVLAATLYIMVADIGGEDVGSLTGSLSVHDRSTSDGNVVLNIASISPSTHDIEDVQVELYDGTDDLATELDGVAGDRDNFDDGYSLAWTRLSDDGETLDSTARLWIEFEEHHAEWDDGYDFDGYEVVLTVDGIGGSVTYEL